MIIMYLPRMSRDYSQVPKELRASHRWLVWKYGEKPNAKGKKPKLPVDLQSGRCIDKVNAACYSFEAVLEARGFEGIGLLPIHPYIALDFDACYDPDTKAITPWVKELLDKLNTYTEVSPSGRGLRCWTRGDAPKAPQNPTTNPMGSYRKPAKGKFEIYPDSPLSNYVTVTGDRLPQYPDSVTELTPEQLRGLYALAEEKEVKPETATVKKPTYTRLQRFNILSLGEWPRLYPPPEGSQSDADMEFCVFLLEAHEGDKAKADADFRHSKLMRDKWDHQRGDRTYGQRTLDLAHEKYLKDPKKNRAENKKPLAPLVVVDFNDLMQKEIQEREPLLVTKGTGATVIYKQSLNQIFASRGVGKTFVATAMAGALSKGEEFLCWKATRPVKVMYVEGELPASQYRDRLKMLVKGVDPGYFKSVILDLQSNNYIPALSIPEGRALVEEALGDTEYLVLDSVSTLVRISTNEEENWLGFLEWLMMLRSKGLTVMVLQHAGKTGLQRGHSRSEDNLDLSINLKHPEEYSHGEGLRAELRFDKVRGYVPDGDEIDISLENEVWTWNFMRSEKTRKIEDFIKQNPGLSDREAAKKLGVSHMTVGRTRRHMHEQDVMLPIDMKATTDDLDF